MVSAPSCHLVGPGSDSRPRQPGGPFVSKSDEEKQSSLCTLVHIHCGVTIKKRKRKINQKEKEMGWQQKDAEALFKNLKKSTEY